MDRRTSALLIGALSIIAGACGATSVATASHESLATSTLAPYSRPPDPRPRCPTDTVGTEDPKGIVPATANIFGAGHDVPPMPASGGGGDLPPVWLLPAGASRIVTFSAVIGCVNPISDVGSGGKHNGPEGNGVGRTDISSYGGISGIVYQHNEMFLVGVFLSDSEPGSEAPSRLEFSDGQHFELLEPELGQTFLIGNGVGHRYRAPAGATRLFLGFADADAFLGPPGLYSNNVGEVHATVEIVVE